MKFLLCAINTRYIHSNPAVYLLRTYVREHAPFLKAEIKTAEFSINNTPLEVMAGIYEEQPDVLLFSCYIWNQGFIEGILPDLSRILPGTDIWLGGPEVSFDAERILERFPCLKGIMTGEGEETFLELVRDYYETREKRPEEIRGICFWNGKSAVTTGKRKDLSMDDIPFIYTDENIGQFAHKIIYYESSRGCPFSCSYCLSSVEKTVRYRSLEKVFREFRFFLNHKVPQVKLVDRTFNADHRRFAAILAWLNEHDNRITNFHFEIAGELLREEELEVMEKMRPGLIQLEIGVQSANPDTLRAIHRDPDLSGLKASVERIRKMGTIHQHLDLIAGLPFEDYESFRSSFNEVYSMKPQALQLGFLKALKGTEIRARAEEYGIVFQNKAPYEVLFTKWISFAQIRKLKQVEEMVERYYNSRQFTKTLSVLETEFPCPFSLFEKLAEFYRQEGYEIYTPSRLYRYQILLDFIRLYIPGREELYRELLTFDLYYRENLKNPPPFAVQSESAKELIRSLRLDKQLHAEVFFHPVHLESAEEITDPRNRKARVLVFDYGKRDPLDHNAAVSVLMQTKEAKKRSNEI